MANSPIKYTVKTYGSKNIGFSFGYCIYRNGVEVDHGRFYTDRKKAYNAARRFIRLLQRIDQTADQYNRMKQAEKRQKAEAMK